VVSDRTQPPAADRDALVAAGRFFAEREVFGLVWIDRDLVVRERYGSKADFVDVGRPVSDSVTPFIGSEPYILSFQNDPSLSLELPGVVIHTSTGGQTRFNLSIFWSSADQHYLMLVARASLDATLEIELLRHVRARLMAEAETNAKSEALARANRDLESFAAIISHDMSAPMRALRSVTEQTLTALDNHDVDEAKRQLAWIRSQTGRMSAMLSSLLDYSSIGRKIEAIECVDTRTVAEAIKDSVPAAGGKTIAVTGTWPVIETLKAPLDLVLRNLVDNAIKHHDRQTGAVTLSCAEVQDALKITVTDDGPGIQPAHREAIFLPFRTLPLTGGVWGSPSSSGHLKTSAVASAFAQALNRNAAPHLRSPGRAPSRCKLVHLLVFVGRSARNA